MQCPELQCITAPSRTRHTEHCTSQQSARMSPTPSTAAQAEVASTLVSSCHSPQTCISPGQRACLDLSRLNTWVLGLRLRACMIYSLKSARNDCRSKASQVQAELSATMSSTPPGQRVQRMLGPIASSHPAPSPLLPWKGLVPGKLECKTVLIELLSPAPSPPDEPSACHQWSAGKHPA